MSVMTVDGRLVRRDQTLRCDAAIVGSGPGGATVARALADASVFPANLGVNSQVSIPTMAQCCAEPIIRSAAALPGHRRQA